jgi:hypothetical protein
MQMSHSTQDGRVGTGSSKKFEGALICLASRPTLDSR